MKLGLKRKIVLVFVAVLAVVSVLDALLASYFTKRQNQDAAFATLERNLRTWQDELQDMTWHMREVALSAIGETVALNQLVELEVLEFKLADAVRKNRNVKEAARTLAFSKTVSLNRLHLVLRSGGFSAISVYIDGKLSHRVSVSEVGMSVRRANDKQVWLKAAADSNGNLPIRRWPAWDEGMAPLAAPLPPLYKPRVAFDYASTDSMLIEVAVPVEGLIEQSLTQDEGNPPELSVFDSRIAGSANDPSIFSAKKTFSPFAVVVFQKRIDQAFLQTVKRKTGMWPQLLSPDGRYRQQLGPVNLSLQELLPGPIAEASAGIYAQTVSTGRGAFYAAALVWQFERQSAFVLALMASQDSTLQNIRQTVLAILAVSGLILASSIVVGIFWLGRFVDPIIALTNAVKEIGLVGRLGQDRQTAYRLTAENLQPLGIHAPGEIGELAGAFDVMIGGLRHSFDTLEQRVQERTVELLSLQQVLEKQNRRLEEQSIELSAGNRTLQEEIGERKLIEDLLRLREQEFRSLAENSPDNIARYDRECRLKYMNPQLRVTLGVADDAAARAHIGKTPTEMYSDGRSDGYEQTIKRVIATGIEVEYELDWPDACNGVRHHLVRMVVERDRSGEILGVLAIGRDITERKQIQHRMELLERAINQASDSIFLIDSQLRFTYVNDTGCRSLGYSREQLSTMTPPDIDPDVSFEEAMAMMNATPVGGNLSFESRHQARDGRIYPVEVSANPFEDGGLKFSLLVIRDITERKQMEDALRKSRQTLNEAQRIAHIGSWELDLVNNVLNWSDEIFRIFEIDPAQFGASYEAFINAVHPDDREMVNRAYTESLANRKPYEIEHRLLMADGRIKYVLELCETDYDDAGKPLYSLGTVQDITERKRMEAELVSQSNFQQTILNAIREVGMQVMVIEEGRIIHVGNRELAEEFGFTEDELNAHPLLADIIHPDDRERVMGYHVRRMAGETVPANYELGLITRHGERREYESSVAIVPDTRPIRMVSIGKDISERKGMEKALAEREQKLRAFMESSPGMAASYYARPDGTVCMPYATANIWELFGLRPEQVADDASPLIALNHPADAERVSASIAESARTMTQWHTEYRVLHPTRGERWIEGNSNPVPHPDGGVIWYGYAHDITERKQAEEEKQRLINILEQSADFIGIADMQGSLIYHNSAARRMVGLPEEADLSDMHFSDMHPLWAVKLLKESAIPAAMEYGLWRGENALLHRDGREIPVDQLVILHRNADGEPEYTSTIMQDITERKRAEDEIRVLNAGLELRVREQTEELRQQTRYLRTMIDTLPMMAWFKDTDSRFLVVNQVLAVAAAGTENVDDLVGKCDLDYWPREHAEAYRADDAEVMASGLRKTVEEPFVDANNGTIWIETFKAPVMDENGRMLGTVGVARDISDRKAVEAAREAALAEAERLARLRSEFMARMSHELRTPLNGILGYAQILLGENRLNERQDTMVSVIQQSGEHLLNLINDILDFSKIEAGKQELTPTDIRLPDLLHNIAGIVGIKAEQKHLSFVCSIADDVPKGGRVDGMRLKQVLLNLLSNAVKYCERGQVSLSVNVLASGALRFEVRDTGIGIEAEQLETIFLPFEQTGDRRYRIGGTGLGLVISRELVKLMGGEIRVESRLGEGSVFWFDLLVPVVEFVDESSPNVQYIAGYLGERRRLLVVDDVDTNRALLVDALGALGFDVAEAANGRECLASVNRQIPDMVLLDMVMPDMDGLDVARRLREFPGFGQTPIVAISASASVTDIDDVISAGIDGFLPKPIEIRRLLKQMAELLKINWLYTLPEAEPLSQQKCDDDLETLPLAEMKILHQLALEGSMRGIIVRCDYLNALDERFRPFAGQLRRLAKNYQSQAVLNLVEHYINQSKGDSIRGDTDE